MIPPYTESAVQTNQDHTSSTPGSAYAGAAAGLALILMVVMAGWPDATPAPQTSWFVTEASLDGSSSVGGTPNAMSIHGFGGDFAFDPPGRFVEYSDGTARLIGVARRTTEPTVAFAVEVDFAGRITPSDADHPPAGSPKIELVSEAYASQGGPADPTTWTYYSWFIGTLTGLDSMDGALLEITRRGPSFQAGVGASGKNSRNGGSAWFDLALVNPPDDGEMANSYVGDFNFDMQDERHLCASDGALTPFSMTSTEHAFTLPGIAKALTFAAPGRFVEYADGTASLSGVLTKNADPTKGFFVDLQFSGRIDPGHEDHPPADSPKMELHPDQYVWNGGPIDPATYSYFDTVTGTLIGFGKWKGGKLLVSRDGPAVQLGFGANGKNLDFGIGTGLTTKTKHAPKNVNWPKKANGDLDVDLDDECFGCAGDPSPTKKAKDPMHVSMVLPGLAEDLVQIVPGRFHERTDGTARFEALLARTADFERMFHLELELASRLVHGDEGHPPDGSPWLGMKKKAHKKKAGPAFPMTWTYFESLEGTLTGLGAFDGMVLDLARVDGTPQFGFGAAGESKGYGAAIPFAWTQLGPSGLPQNSSAQIGELRVRMDVDCESAPVSLPIPFGVDCAPPGGPAPQLQFLGALGVGPVRAEVRNGVPFADVFLLLGTGRGSHPLPTGCTQVIDTVLAVLGPYQLDAEGSFGIDGPFETYLSPATLSLQALIHAPTSESATAGVEWTVP